MVIYLLLILLCYLSMIVYKELLSQKLMTVWYGVVPSSVFIIFILILYPLSTPARNIFSQFIYPSWFFALFGFIQTYLILMLPMFFGTVYMDNRRKAWSAMIIPSAFAIFMFVLFGRYLFYEIGWLIFYMILLYLAWGIACVLTPRLLWTRYIKLRDKFSRRILFGIVSGIMSTVFLAVVCVIIFTIVSNIGKVEADYLPPHMVNPPTTQGVGE